PALAVGGGPIWVGLNPSNHTIYAPAQALNSVWVLDASKCNASKTSGCTDFAPVTKTGAFPIISAASQASRLKRNRAEKLLCHHREPLPLRQRASSEKEQIAQKNQGL